MLFNRKVGTKVKQGDLVPLALLTEEEKVTMFAAIKERQAKAAAKMVRDHERRHEVTSVPRFALGDRVMVHTPDDHKVRAKFPLKWQTSGVIAEVFEGKTPRSAQYRLKWISRGLSGEEPGSLSKFKYGAADLKAVPPTVSSAQLRKLVDGNTTAAAEFLAANSEDDEDNDSWFLVEAVPAFRVNADGKKEFLVQWANYDALQSTWEPVYVVACVFVLSVSGGLPSMYNVCMALIALLSTESTSLFM